MSATTKTQGQQEEKRKLPDGWRWVKLGEVCKQDRQIIESNAAEADLLTYFSLEQIESETGRMLKAPIERVEDAGKSTTFRFDEHHVLYGKLRPYLNKVALPDSLGRCTTEMIPLRPCDGVDRIFLAWLLRRRETMEFAMQGKTGSRMPRADMDSLLNLEIPLPPLSEQQRIAARLREQMAAVEKVRTSALARLKAVKDLPAAFLRQVFPQPGQPLPDGWRWVKLGEACEKITDGTHRSPANGETGIPYITAKNIRRFAIDLTELTFVSLKDHKEIYSRCDPKRGDVLYIKDGATMGIAAVNTLDYEFSMLSSVALIRPDTTLLNADFLASWLNHPETFRSVIKAQLGSAIKRMVLSQLAKMTIPLPPLAEQEHITSILKMQMAAVEKARGAAEEELNTINILPAAFLRKAFNGEL